MNAPLVTIGLVVHNGADFLAEAIQSFLDQTFAAFELVVFDNASTDDTPDIAARFARVDSRIRVVRHETDIGALHNFIVAAESAHTPYFCWAAHDDLRLPEFLATLVRLLEIHSSAQLATCGAAEIDPDGSFRSVCRSTSALRPPQESTMTRRLLNYLRYSPCSLIYGLFRTAAVQRALPMLKENARPCQRSVFGGDLVFLAGFVKDHDWVHAPDTLLLLRGGGESHRPDVFRNLGHLMRELWVFHRRLRAVTGVCGWRNRITVGWARLRLFVRHLLGPPLLRLFHYHIIRVIPLLRPIVSSFTLWRNPAIRGLRHRARQLEAGTKIAIVGAGKHTQRNFGVIRRALGRRVQIAAIVDDRAKRISPIHGIAVISPEQLLTVHADILLVSSDAYERSLSQRASEIAAPRQQIWCIYDLANENCADRRVVENPHAMTLAA